MSPAPLYASVMKMKPEGKHGQIIKQERVSTPITGTQALRIAHVSSDINDNKTISTAVVVAPTGTAPKAGRPVVIWSHGTTGSAATPGLSEQYYLPWIADRFAEKPAPDGCANN